MIGEIVITTAEIEAISAVCLDHRQARGFRSSQSAMASIGWFVAAATRSNPPSKI